MSHHSKDNVVHVDFAGPMKLIVQPGPFKSCDTQDGHAYMQSCNWSAGLSYSDAPEAGEHAEAATDPVAPKGPYVGGDAGAQIVPDFITAVSEIVEGVPTGMVVIRAIEDDKVVDLMIDICAATALVGYLTAGVAVAASALQDPPDNPPDDDPDHGPPDAA